MQILTHGSAMKGHSMLSTTTARSARPALNGLPRWKQVGFNSVVTAFMCVLYINHNQKQLHIDFVCGSKFDLFNCVFWGSAFIVCSSRDGSIGPRKGGGKQSDGRLDGASQGTAQGMHHRVHHLSEEQPRRAEVL